MTPWSVLQINNKYHKPHIILVVYPSEVLQQGVLPKHKAAIYRSYMGSLFEKTQKEGRVNVHLVQLNANDMQFDGWCASHPSANADANIAAQLSTLIQETLPEWVDSTFH